MSKNDSESLRQAYDQLMADYAEVLDAFNKLSTAELDHAAEDQRTIVKLRREVRVLTRALEMAEEERPDTLRLHLEVMTARYIVAAHEASGEIERGDWTGICDNLDEVIRRIIRDRGPLGLSAPTGAIVALKVLGYDVD